MVTKMPATPAEPVMEPVLELTDVIAGPGEP
ncbi:MAG: hypothetical protein Ct9H300mP12_11720 [Acidimicrobiales bacterium]|nr:MAG: hypothetical protein Ct9H300mP12_11720 [Acidimicrobiales bacterium]